MMTTMKMKNFDCNWKAWKIEQNKYMQSIPIYDTIFMMWYVY